MSGVVGRRSVVVLVLAYRVVGVQFPRGDGRAAGLAMLGTFDRALDERGRLLGGHCVGAVRASGGGRGS